MKKIISLFIVVFCVNMLSLTACAAAPEVAEGVDAVTVTNISNDDFALVAVYDDSLVLEGVEIYKNMREISVNYKSDIFDKYDKADYLKLFVWSKNQEPKMTAYGIGLSKYRTTEPITESRDINIQIGERTLSATLSDNSSADAFLELLKQGDVTVDMRDYGNFEKVGSLPTGLPRNDEQITTEPGDIILYQGNQITIYYDTNTWSFTRLGRVNGLSQAELKTILGSGNITAVFSLASGKRDYPVADITLNSGYTMPVLGLGTWTQDNETTANSVYYALKDGYRLIDTAQYYGNEKGVGEGVRKAIDEGIVTREEVFITSKVMPMNYDNAYASITQSNEMIGLDYIDLMLIHQSGSNDKQVYRALEQAVKDGTIKSLGISNYYTQAEFDRITEGAEIMPAVVQNENHPFYQNTDLQEYVKQYGTVVESYYPLGGRGHTQDLLGNETVNEIAEAHNKTAAQIILRWHIQAGYVAIPGSSNPDHIAENYDILDFELTDDEMNTMAELDTGNRYENW